jgi:U3 small nucleolar RNA-associated protein MPP10
MKAVPVITEAVVQGLEERIKARIKDGRFDDVARIRPVDDKPFLPSRFFELQDTKSSQSLAQIYEGEYVATQNGGTSGDDRDGRLKKEHDEITKLWDNICSKLDALCNAHYTPKAVRVSLYACGNITNISTAESEHIDCLQYFCGYVGIDPPYQQIHIFYACSRRDFQNSIF